MRTFKILGSGVYLPPLQVSSEELDKKHGLKKGTIVKRTGVSYRHFAQIETASVMAVEALNQASIDANISLSDIDCLIAASGTMERAIPCNAANILAELNLLEPITGFDVNATCLSGLLAMDLASSLLLTKQYKCIAVVSSDLASPALNWEDIECAGLFGDGAAALILTSPSLESETNQTILASQFKTYPVGLNLCQVRGGGSLNHPSKINEDYTPYCYFEMQGKELYRTVVSVIGPFLDELFAKTELTLADIDWLIPHQASGLAMKHLFKKLGIKPEKVINLLHDRGNQISVSLPSGLHELRQSGKAKFGDKVLMLGTSAGLSIGGVILTL
ncbi:3-oxoacyl-[acyl-carrier-protein] synthase III C-terminal domain-containing protein [Psychromonas sp. MME2]|uniref:3-oxoacyl-[acyl-carrier-protein] synthase III C-terminal domain-containing protein n=1 Tax=unclassified Psychromonas TaxID=2614957 RepID=UPI00339C55BD